jgi:serine/threonine protein kinase
MFVGATLQDSTGALGVHLQGLAFEQCYTLLERLRSGSFGTVYTTQLKQDGSGPATDKTIYACKVIDRTKLKPESDATVFRELHILRDIRELDHITQLKDCFVTPTHVYVVQTYCRGGDVFHKLSQLSTYTELEARNLAVTLLKVMQLLHLRKLVHRDLKPENLLLQNRMQASQIVVADFGMAQYLPPKTGYLTTRCGTPAFVAPEVIAGKPYDTQVDMWSIGTLVYMILGGRPPFSDPTFQGLFRRIQAADYDFNHPAFATVSIPAKQCLASLLRVDPYYRATATQALEQSAWFTLPEDQIRGHDLTSSVKELKTWVAKRKFKSAVHAVRLSSHFSKFHATDRASLFQKIQAWDNNNNEDYDPDNSKNNAPLISQWRGKSNNFDELYEKLELIAQGNNSKVYKCIRKATADVPISIKKLSSSSSDIPLVVKQIPRTAELEPTVLHEVAVMQNLQHPSLVQILDFLEDRSFYYLVMEYVPGGTLLEHLTSHHQVGTSNAFTEADVRKIVKSVLQAVAYIHREGVVHRDVTLDNLLLATTDMTNNDNDKDDNNSKFRIKLCDFGLARRVPAPRSVTRCCGTPHYRAPEILKNIPYDQSADLWSCGVLLYCLLYGIPPFSGATQQELFAKIRRGEYSIPPPNTHSVGVEVSDAAQELLRHLLVVEPLQRWTAEEALRANWFQQDTSSLSSIDLSKSVSKLKDLRMKFKTVAKVAALMLSPSPANNSSSNHGDATTDEDDAASVRYTKDDPFQWEKISPIKTKKSHHEEQQENETNPQRLLDNETLGLPACQTNSVKLIV